MVVPSEYAYRLWNMGRLGRLLRNCDLTLRVALCAPVAFPLARLRRCDSVLVGAA